MCKEVGDEEEEIQSCEFVFVFGSEVEVIRFTHK